jgi:electron transfer flavoprotein-quinone oxidoreductase
VTATSAHAADVPSADVIVVGAGPAGSAAATVLARKGYSVILLERGSFPGSKNMYGGVVYPRILDQLHPEWWHEAPIQRWITRRSTMVHHRHPGTHRRLPHRSGWGKPPYNGATAFRPDFDHWLAGKAEADGAHLVVSTTATGLLRDERGHVGVTTDRPDGELHRLVIACDGVNSFLAKEAGLYGDVDAANFTVGVKETIALPKRRHRRALRCPRPRGRRHRDPRCTSGVNGGGFVYTNLDTLAVGSS